VFSREAVAAPAGDAAACDVDGSLNCHGYGSSVAVTAAFGMVAAARALALVAEPGGTDGRAGHPIILGSEGC
jgi:tRNA A37 threonylcarbamoyladenosine dehydratase